VRVTAISKKKKEKKYEENKPNFENAYLRNSLLDSAQNWNWECLTLRDFAQKFLFVVDQGVC